MPERLTRSRRSLNGATSQPPPKQSQKASTVKATKKRVKREQSPAPAAKPAKRARTSNVKPDLQEAAKVAAKIQAHPDGPAGTELSPSKAKSKSKANPYNLTPGASPYPTYPRPTPEECHNVNDLLAAIHGSVTAPKTIPAPNLQSSGCGEVPSVLDALIRTRLSAATNGANSSRAFRGLVDTFGILKSGVGKGSVDWDRVRKAPQKDVFEAIKSGGLADVKSRDIQKILNMVYEENKAQAMSNPSSGQTPSKQTVLSLDHLHGMESEAAFNKLLEYPGIGPKTASCVLLFCMQRPSFAVDTHVFRLVSWLGWVPPDSTVRRMAKEAKAAGVKPPPPVTRNSTYAHLDVRIPDDLKYSLHYLFIKHGKTCPSCSAKKDGKIKLAWGDKKCPLAALKTGKGVDAVKKVVEEGDYEQVIKKEEEEEEEGEEEEAEENDADDEDVSEEEMHNVRAKKSKSSTKK